MFEINIQRQNEREIKNENCCTRAQIGSWSYEFKVIFFSCQMGKYGSRNLLIRIQKWSTFFRTISLCHLVRINIISGWNWAYFFLFLAWFVCLFFYRSLSFFCVVRARMRGIFCHCLITHSHTCKICWILNENSCFTLIHSMLAVCFFSLLSSRLFPPSHLIFSRLH